MSAGILAAAGVGLLVSAAMADSRAVGDEACADCHPGIVDAWRATSMSRALDSIRPEELAGLAPIVDAASFRYQLEKSGERVRLVETFAAGSPPHRDSTPLEFAIGAGTLDRSYVALKHGRMWFAPLEAVTHGEGKRSAAAPFLTMEPGARLTQPITPECLGCHTDAPPPRDWPLNLRPKPEVWEPRGLSCGACHTALEEHVEWRETELSGAAPAGEDPTLSYSTLDRDAGMSVCAACHLQGDARIELVPDRMGPPEPGGDLLQTRAVFVGAEPTHEVGFVSHTERLVLSDCYLSSESMSCVTCHDPHSSLKDPVVRARARGACAACHEPHELEQETSKDCVDCHMRKTRVFDVEHVEIHDHWIRTRSGASGPPSAPGPLRFPESAEGNWRRFAWPGVEPPAHLEDPGLLMMALFHGGHEERALELVDERPHASVGALPMYHHVRGSLLERAGRLPQARSAYEAALALDPRLAESMNNLGLLLGRIGAPQEGIALLSKLITMYPKADGAYRNRAIVRSSIGDSRGAIQDLEQAMRLRPTSGVARVLARGYGQLGRTDQERRWTEEARRLDPRTPR